MEENPNLILSEKYNSSMLWLSAHKMNVMVTLYVNGNELINISQSPRTSD